MKKIAFLIGVCCVFLAPLVFAQDGSDIDHSYKPLTVKLDDSGHKYVRFILWHQQWLQTNNLAQDDTKLQLNSLARRSRVLAYAQISPRFLVLTHFGLNNLSANNLTSLGNDGNGPQLFLHGAWGEFKVSKNTGLYLGAGLHYWKGLTRLANQSTLNFMTMDNPRPFVPWHSLGITDQFARHLGVYAKGTIGKFEYRMAINNPLNPANSLGAGRDFGTANSDITYNGRNILNEDGDPTGNTIFEGYFQYSFFDGESAKLPYKVGSYLGKKKVFNIGAGFFAHPNGTYDNNANSHENVTHLALDAFLDMPLAGEDCLNAYASFMNFNYGEDYVSRWAGTGNVFYGHVGYKFPKTPIMPYLALQSANYDGFEETVTGFHFGVNYFVGGHNAKLTLEYYQLTNDIREGAIADFGDNNTFSQLRMQLHVFL